MSKETREHLSDAWLPLTLVAIGVCGLIVQAALAIWFDVVPYVVRSVDAALN